MLAGNGFKRLVADSAARAGIRWTPRSQSDCGLSALNICHFHILPRAGRYITAPTRTPHIHAVNVMLSRTYSRVGLKRRVRPKDSECAFLSATFLAA
jgi:hypothetical protein